ncbi:BC1881 family protein [Desulfotomaculum sp. 1211_IL3151]|uniref:BC1881 family protein n=1 Tax=Desulfotomaculum sp. 1211_IL3151 TaxID=3084055 RepID=UPI002FDA4DF2
MVILIILKKRTERLILVANKLSDYTTAELVRELQKREAVEKIDVQPHEEYIITANGHQVKGTGPSIMLTVTD